LVGEIIKEDRSFPLGSVPPFQSFPNCTPFTIQKVLMPFFGFFRRRRVFVEVLRRRCFLLPKRPFFWFCDILEALGPAGFCKPLLRGIALFSPFVRAPSPFQALWKMSAPFSPRLMNKGFPFLIGGPFTPSFRYRFEVRPSPFSVNLSGKYGLFFFLW